ncbi:MAG TPA: type II toxin-antitoxin system HigB family toxin [Acidobacteriota bacterium]|nr:type II toxin-antitoxin system HigB family toxin [Acidobacteriota bacterium]
MKVISRKVIVDYVKKHADVRQALLSWYSEARSSVWKTPQDIKERYSSARFIGDNTVIFNIKGNKYRLVAKIAYKTKTVLIKWVGTHAEYDKQKF